MSRLPVLIVTLIAATIAAACAGLSDPKPQNIEGAWQMGFGAAAAGSGGGRINCSTTGSISISQNSEIITGQLSGSNVICVSDDLDSTTIGSIDGPIENGTITKSVLLSFRIGNCYFDKGLITMGNNDITNGNVGCLFTYQAESRTFSGSFALSR